METVHAAILAPSRSRPITNQMELVQCHTISSHTIGIAIEMRVQEGGTLFFFFFPPSSTSSEDTTKHHTGWKMWLEHSYVKMSPFLGSCWQIRACQVPWSSHEIETRVSTVNLLRPSSSLVLRSYSRRLVLNHLKTVALFFFFTCHCAHRTGTVWKHWQLGPGRTRTKF